MLSHALTSLTAHAPAFAGAALHGLRSATCSFQQRRGMLWSVEREQVGGEGGGAASRATHPRPCAPPVNGPAPERLQGHTYRPVDEIIDDKAITQALEATKQAAKDPLVRACGGAATLGCTVRCRHRPPTARWPFPAGWPRTLPAPHPARAAPCAACMPAGHPRNPGCCTGEVVPD